MIKATITAKNEQLVIESAKTLDARLLQACEIGLARGLQSVVTVAQLEYLSGPRPARIQSVTGSLRQRMTSRVSRAGNRVIGRVGNNVKYAAFHEFGFHGTQNVRAHSRVMDQVNAAGNPVDTRRAVRSDTGALLGFKESRKASTKFQKSGFVAVQYVRAHARRVNYAGKPFVRPALTQQIPVIRQEIIKELKLVK